MPELPEIETIKRDLTACLPGQAVLRMTVRDSRLLSEPAENRLRAAVIGTIWKAIHRKGKYLVVHLANGHDLIFHLRMTGQLVLSTAAGPQPAYRMLFEFDHGVRLAFYDQRRFGEVFLREPGGPWPGKTELGPDPLNELTRDAFIGSVRKRTTRIKPLLMDQRFLAGIGNIYAQEALFKAAIRPMRPGNRITRDEAGSLYSALRETLLTAIERRGSTRRNYRDAFGQSGSAQALHSVYDRGGQPCLQCAGVLRYSRMGGRGTVYCPKCQR